MTLPDYRTVDFTSPASISAYVAQLCILGNQLDMLTRRYTPTPQRTALRAQTDRFLRLLLPALRKMPKAAAEATFPAYDLAHRIAYLTPAAKI